MKRVYLVLLVLMMAFSFVGCGPKAEVNVETPTEEVKVSTEAAVAGSDVEIPANIAGKKLKFMLIYETGAGTYASQFISGFKRQCEALGIEAIVSDAAGSQDKMVSFLDAAINQKVDAIIISHGRADALIPGVKRALEAGIPVVTKDVELNLEDVPTVDQDDFMLGLLSVRAMGEDLQGKGNIVRAYAAGFLPQERRNAMYQMLLTMRYPEMKEVSTFGPVSASTALDSQTKMEAILKQYPGEGEIAGVWCGWEEWAKGASRAIMEAGRADEIKVYGIDISDETLQMLQDPNNPYTGSAGLDPAMAGDVVVRMALLKLGGGYIPKYYSFPVTLVRKSQLPSDRTVTMTDLAEFVPGWGENTDFWTPWMKAMLVP